MNRDFQTPFNDGSKVCKCGVKVEASATSIILTIFKVSGVRGHGM